MNVATMPFSERMEKCVISVLLRDAQQFEDCVRSRLPLEAFYIPAHRHIADSILWLANKRKPVDFWTVRERLESLGLLEDVGGEEYLNSLVNFVLTTSGMDEYVSTVRDKWMLRTTMMAVREIYGKCADRDAEWATLKLEVETLLLNLSRDGEVEDKSLREITLEWQDQLESRLERNDKRGFWLGIKKADEKLGPSLPGELVVLASETSGGKTAMAMQGGLATADNGLGVGVFSLEMMNEQMWDRMFSHLAKVSMSKWRRPMFNEYESARLLSAATRFVDLPLHINQRRRIDLAALSSKARRLKASKKIGVLIVDYLQRVRGSQKNGRNRYLEVAEVSDELKQLALELEIVVVAPCQVNKDGGARESADIENDADRFFVLKENELWIEKDRQNKRWYGIPIRFDGEFMTFEDGEPSQQESAKKGKTRAVRSYNGAKDQD